MPLYREARTIAAPVDLFFDLVADVESYPQFLPFWRDARIIERDQDGYYTEQSIGVGPLSDRFQTKTRLDRPNSILITPHRSGRLFNRFHIEWQFVPADGTQTKVSLTFDVEPRAFLLRRLAASLIQDTAEGMLTAFEQRARSAVSEHKASG